MTHRVLADFNVRDVSWVTGDNPPALDEIRKLLVENGWETAVGEQSRDIFHVMADALPSSDIPSFVRNTKLEMSRKGPKADLTVGCFPDASVGKVRVRVRAENNAVIAELGKRTATQLLTLPQLEHLSLDLFESRDAEPLLQGGEVQPERYRFWGRDNLQVSVPLIFSLIGLVLGGLVAAYAYHSQLSVTILGDHLWVWYGRVFGPLLMAIVTTGAVLMRDRRPHQNRRADWEILVSSDGRDGSVNRSDR